MVFSETQFKKKIAFGLPGYTIPETNSLPLKISPPKKKGSSPNHQFQGKLAVSFKNYTLGIQSYTREIWCFWYVFGIQSSQEVF